jgi:hypothetical protein
MQFSFMYLPVNMVHGTMALGFMIRHFLSNQYDQDQALEIEKSGTDKPLKQAILAGKKDL